jgi:hypothetical protein
MKLPPSATLHYHDGKADFPHGAGPSEKGWYAYGPHYNEPDGPFHILYIVHDDEGQPHIKEVEVDVQG